MKNLIKKLETIFAAAAYAEEGDMETAKKMVEEIREGKRPVKISRAERAMMAIAFAEAGEHDTAIEIMRENKTKRKTEHPRVVEKRKRQARVRYYSCKREPSTTRASARLTRT